MAKNQTEFALVDEKGATLLNIKSVMQVGIKSDGGVVFEPIEENSFAVYNKTSSPLELPVQLAFAGSRTELSGALAALSDLKKQAIKFSLVTPYQEYQNLTLERYDTQMSLDDGWGVLYVNASLIEVVEVGVEYSSYSPSDASTVNTGSTSTRQIAAAEQKEVEKAREESAAHKVFG